MSPSVEHTVWVVMKKQANMKWQKLLLEAWRREGDHQVAQGIGGRRRLLGGALQLQRSLWGEHMGKRHVAAPGKGTERARPCSHLRTSLLGNKYFLEKDFLGRD